MLAALTLARLASVYDTPLRARPPLSPRVRPAPFSEPGPCARAHRGGGVAALETLLALRALAGDRVDITLLSPERRFVNRSMAVDQPFKPQRVRGFRLQDAATEFGARWQRGAVDRVEGTSSATRSPRMATRFPTTCSFSPSAPILRASGVLLGC